MKKNLFSFGELSKFHIIPFLVPLFFLSTTYVQRDITNVNKKEDQKNDNEFDEDSYEFPYFIVIFISKIFSGIFYIISKYIINKDEIETELNTTRTKRIYHLNVNNKSKLKKLYHIIIISILEVIFTIEKVRTLEVTDLIEIKLGYAIFVPVFTYIILKNKCYRHHFVSIAIGLFGFIFIVLSLFYPNEDETKHKFKEHLRHFIFSIPFSLSLVTIKHLFKYYFINPFSFLFLDGIFCLFFSFIYILIKTVFNNTDLFINNLKNVGFIFLDVRLFLLVICIFITSFLYYLTCTLTLYYFTPTLLVMTDILSPIIRWIVDCMVNIFYHENYINEKQAIFKAIGYTFLIIASTLFNEIIICNFWKMDYNTIEEIELRGIEDAIKRDNSLCSINDSIISNY